MKEDHAGAGQAHETDIYSIGQLAREFGVTLRALRFYEDKGLLTPRRRGLERLYGRRDRARLKLILLGKRVGFSLDEIKEVLDLYDLKDAKVEQLRAALGKFRAQAEHLERQKRDIEEAMRELDRTVEVITGLLRQKGET